MKDGDTKFFVNQQTGERKLFTAGSYVNNTTSMWNEVVRTTKLIVFWRSDDGDRLDPQDDGTWKNEWQVVWKEEG